MVDQNMLIAFFQAIKTGRINFADANLHVFGLIGIVQQPIVTHVMGQYNVQVVAAVTPSPGEFLTTVPKCKVFANNAQVAEATMSPGVVQNWWNVTVFGVFPEPDALIIEATFMDSSYTARPQQHVEIL